MPSSFLCSTRITFFCHFQVVGVPSNLGQLQLLPCCPLPEIPFKCYGGTTEPFSPPFSPHPQEDQAVGDLTRVSEDAGGLGGGNLTMPVWTCVVNPSHQTSHPGMSSLCNTEQFPTGRYSPVFGFTILSPEGWKMGRALC